VITDERLKKQVQELIRKAARSIAAAKRHMEDGDYDFASSRAYYAAFYAMEASLLTKNLVFAKHSGVISAFNEHFLRTDTFPKEFSKLITRLFRNRQIGDYEFDVSIEAREAKEDILSAERIVKAVETHLKKSVL
jgi:uncharacterized protein (UPF0332 family)